MGNLNEIREAAYDMRPLDAVDYLLDVIGQIHPAIMGEEHAIDYWGLGLTRSERVILSTLYDTSPSCVTRESLHSLMHLGRNPDKIYDTLPGNVDRHISNIRQKIPPNYGRIKTHRQRGYSFERCRKEEGET